MRTSILRQPPGAYFIRKWEWALTACEGNQPAAELISVFLYHYDNRTANRILAELVQRAIAKNGKRLLELGDWMPYSNAYMRELLLQTHGRHQIDAGIEMLERLGFLSLNVPAEIREFYSKAHSWFKLEIDNIQDWIDDVWITSNPPTSPVYWIGKQDLQEAIETVTNTQTIETESFEAKPLAPIVPKEEVEQHPKLDTLTKKIDAVCAFDKHIHARHHSFAYDKERREMIKARLKERDQDVGWLALATIGLTFSDWHYARHPENTLGARNSQGNKGKIYNEPKYVFSSAEKFTRAIGYAESNDVSVSRARTELFAFLDGNPSSFSVANQKQTIEVKKLEKTAEERKPYISFAHSVVRFFLSNVPSDQIMEMCEAGNLGSGLTDKDLIFETLLDAAKTYNANGGISAPVRKTMEQFAADFAEIEEMNM